VLGSVHLLFERPWNAIYAVMMMSVLALAMLHLWIINEWSFVCD